jgi:hypothetical protein
MKFIKTRRIKMFKCKGFYSLGMVFAFSLAVGAQNLVKNGDAEAGRDNWQIDQVQICTDKPHSGKNCFKTLGIINISSEFIPVDAAKTYKLSGWFKSVDDKNINLYLGLVPFDENKKQIQCIEVNAISGTETELVEACKAGDTVLKIKDGKNWSSAETVRIAFNVDASGECKDIPNRNIAIPAIVKIEQKENYWEVNLKKNCEKAYPAGTKVRLHMHGGNYIYPEYSVNFNSKEWQELLGVIKGTAKIGQSNSEFWNATKYVKIIILSVNGFVYFDDIKFEEVKPE